MLAEPAKRAADEPVLVPLSAHHLGSQVAEPVSGEGGWSSSSFVLDLPGPLVHEMRAPQAEVHFGMVAQLHHAVGNVDGVAAPARDAPVVMRVDGGEDWFRAHRASVRAFLHAPVVLGSEGQRQTVSMLAP
jgi:hypothetical protein